MQLSTSFGRLRCQLRHVSCSMPCTTIQSIVVSQCRGMSVMLVESSGATSVPYWDRGSSVQSSNIDVLADRAAETSGKRSREYRVTSRQHEIPPAYVELLRNTQTDTSDVDKASSDGSSEQATFWRSVRKLAKERLHTLPPDLTRWERHVNQLHESLWIEELGAAFELQRLCLSADELPSIGDGLYLLYVSDLSDKISVLLDEKGLLRGVTIRITCHGGTSFKAAIQPSSGRSSLVLSASLGLAQAEGPFRIEFLPHRFQQLAMHRALDAPQVETIIRTSIMQGSDESETIVTKASRESDTLLETLPASLNEGQRRAVAAALEVGQTHPLVIWGPPGTGKSTIAAFAVWHLVQQRPKGLHVLIAAPSNVGADIICAKLAKLGLDESRLLRLNALGRSPSTVPESIRSFCFSAPEREDNRQKSFAIPPIPQLKKMKVVVTTCICAAHLTNALRMAAEPTGWFSHVMVDEAGEATEPETLVPLSLLRPLSGRLVLLGDHFQLGPLVVSPLAARLGKLDRSMIERLVHERFGAAARLDDNNSHGLDKDVLLACEDRGLFFLTESYRSHPSIMSLYSSIFYGDQLEHRPRPQQNRLSAFFEAQGVSEPVILHNIVGAERRDPGSASVYNVEEIRIVQQYLVDLLTDSGLGLKPEDVGIITPYNKQVHSIEQQLATLGTSFTGVDVGTVERFQGQERQMILMSTVRCSTPEEGGGGTARRPIGFVADPQRLNVAISRAVAGLIVVGDLRTLARHSAKWRLLVEMADEMGAIRGDPLEPLRSASPPEAPLPPDVGGATRTVLASESSAAWEALTRNSE